MMHYWFTRARAEQAETHKSRWAAGRKRVGCGWLVALIGAAMSAATVPLTAAGNAELISVDFVVGGSGGDGSGHTAPCADDTVLTGTTMNNAAGNLYSGQAGTWNFLHIGTYNQASASSGFLTNGAGGVTTAKMVLGQATGLNATLAGGWRCSPNEGTPGTVQQLRAETAYLYNGVITGDHFAWGFTGLVPNSTYMLTLFGGGNATGISNVAGGVAGIRDTEGDWNWASLTADSSGTITGTFTATSSTPGLYGAQLEHLPRTQPPTVSPGAPVPADGSMNLPTAMTLTWSTSAGAESYDVYLWSSSRGQPAVPTASVTVGQYTPPGFLQALTSYSWQVVARNPAGVMNGPIWTFSTDDGRPLAPATPTPATAATNVLVEAQLDWADSLGANSYQVFVWLASASRPATPTATLTSSSYQLTQPLLGNSLYNWQVVAVNANGATPGAVWTFTTGDRYPGYLVPWPKTVTMGTGDFNVTSATRIVAEDALLLPLAQVMAKDFFMASGLSLTAMQGTAGAGDIALRFNPFLTGEAYTLDVNGSNMILSGPNYQAVAWASVTLLQALDTTGTPVKVAQMLIADQPAAPLRTVMWDIGRFFHPLETLYEFVDLHRMYKVTYMHLFMSADGLFTFGTDIPALAALKTTSNGVSSAGMYVPPTGTRMYYTTTELRALVEYAKNRGVIIVPEIDTPSWAAFMTQKLPAVFCSTGGTTVTHDINLNYPTAVTTLKSLLTEMAGVFSTSPYIHIGADEVPAADYESYPYYATSKVTNNYASGAEALAWYLYQLDSTLAGLGKSSWAWGPPGDVNKGYNMRKNMVYTAWGYDDGQGPSASGYSVMRAAGGHVAGYGQQSQPAPYNRCLLYRPAEGIYNRLTPLLRFLGAPDAMYTDLTPTFVPLTGHEDKILGAHIMEWETPWEVEVPAFRLSMPALGEPTWNQENSTRRNWDNFLMRQKQTDALYQRVMRPVNLSVTTQVDAKDACFVTGGMVTMSSPVAGTIRYTVGTNYNNSWYNFPINTSTAYTGPFAITQSSVISARLYDAAGNPLGNPVTRGFYLITPKTHYKYFFTGITPAANFEKGTPLVSSVMGMMNGNAPQEDVRFGDTEHRTIYSGALNITTAGAYTFSASYGGTISIDRVPVTNGMPVTLTTGEHIFKIITPASGLGTPYTYSGGGASAGTDLNNLLKLLNSCAQVFPASYAFGTQSLSSGATAKKEITIVNHSPFNNLTITSVALAGANPEEFLIDGDTGETVLAPGAERIVALRFNPATAGSKTATLHVVAANLAGGATDSALTGTAVVGTLPSTPATPSPASGASGITTTPTLDWADAAGATRYEVYLWLASGSKPGTATATISVSQWTPPALTNNLTYNWQVVAINGNGSTSGAQWSFHTGTSTVQFSNLVDGQEFRYSMVMVDGIFDGGATLTITATPATTQVTFTKYGTRFRCLADLRPGTNTLTITDGHGAVALNLVFTPPTATNYRYKVWYVVPSDEANTPVDPNFAAHFSLQTKLMQSWMAEDQKRAGHGRLTFYPELDASGDVSVEKLVVTQTRAQATALGTGMFDQVYSQIPAGYKDGSHKNVAFSSVAFNALGGGDLSYVGAYSTTGFHPDDATQMMTQLLSTQLGNDNALTYASYCGVTLHEIIHGIHDIWHDGTLYNIMGGSAYDISQYFTLTYSASNNAAHSETSAATLGTQRDLASWNRYLMSADPHVYQNATVGVAAGPEYLTATSANPLAVFHYYIPDSSADLHVNLDATPATSYSKHAGQARQELGASPFNVMAVDTEGNMSYGTFSGAVPVVAVSDSYTVSGGTTVTAAPGVLANDTNPSNNTLSASVVTNVQHGTLVLNTNGGFSYTPATNYVGTDTFTYTVSDGVSSTQRALVTLTVTAMQMAQPTTPLPSNGVTGVAVNTALDWADVAGATHYDVFLWQTSQTKPATASANIGVSQWLPPANLLSGSNYSWQVVANNAGGTVAGPTWSFTTQALVSLPANLVSLDVVTSTSIAVSGDVAGSPFTGQTGLWNRLQMTGSQVTLSGLKNGSGTATGVGFVLGSGYGQQGGSNPPVSGVVLANNNPERAWITGSNTLSFKFTGLTRGGQYGLAIFNTGSPLTVLTINGTPHTNVGTIFTTTEVANASGEISGVVRFTGAADSDYAEISGFQLYKQAASATLTANAGLDQSGAPATLGGNPVAMGGSAPYAYSWSPATGLSSATVANPTATAASTTTYTVTVTDFLGATASDSVVITVGDTTATALTSTPAAMGPYGTAVVFAASVSPAVSGGTVTFMDGDVNLGTPVTVSAGTATFTTSAAGLAVGPHSITAIYSGSGSFTGSTAAPCAYEVSAKPVTLTGVTAAGKVYDKTNAAVLTGGAVLGVVGTETVTVTPGTGAFDNPNVGSQTITAINYGITGADATHYVLSAQPTVAAATITAKGLLVNGLTLPASKPYDGNLTATVTGTATGLLTAEAGGAGSAFDGKPYTGDTVGVSGSSAGTGSYNSKDVATATTVTYGGVNLTGANATNYVLQAPATITPKPLALDGNRYYDGTTAIGHADLAIQNRVGGDDVNLASGSTTLVGKNAGAQACVAGSVVTPARIGTAATGSTGTNPASSFNVTVAQPAGGNTLVAVISTRSASAGAVSAISQSGGAVWTRAAQSTGTAGTTTEIWYAPNIQGAGTNVTAHLTSSLFASAVVTEYSGVLAASPLNQTANSSGSGTSAVTGTSGTTAQANELWIGGIGVNSSTPTLGTPLNAFTSVANALSSNATAASNANVYALEKLPGAAGAASSGGTIAGTVPGTIAQRGIATTASITTGGSLGIVVPAGVVAGDVMIVTITKIGSTSSLTAPTGWTVISQATLRSTTTLTYGAVMYRVATGSEGGATVTFTLGTTSSAVGDIVAFSGVDTTGGVKQDGTAGGPFDVAPVAILAQTSSGISAVGASTLTTVSANAAVLMCGMAGGTVTWANTGNWMIATGPQNLTEIADNHQATAGSVGVAWATKAAAGATGAGAVTLSGTARNGGILLALRPASGTPQWSGAIATFKPQPAALSGTLALGGTTAGDYTLAGAGGAATILALQLTVTAVSATKVYDGTLAAAGTPVLTPALATGDTTTALGQVFETKDAGEGNKVIVPNITIDDGNGGANYAVTPVNFPSGTIHKAAASITLGNLAQTYDGSPKAASASTVPIDLAVDLTYDGAASAPSAAGSYAVVASANDLNYAGSTSGTLVIAAETIVAWRSGHFTADEITAGLAADAADADGDGLTNLTEYTLGSDPCAFTSQPLVLTRAADDSLNLTFVARRAAGAGYAGTTRKYVVESTADLTHPAAWQGVAGFTDIVGDDQTITVPVPGGQPGRFCRLNVRLE